jgi:hypothetical protein
LLGATGVADGEACVSATEAVATVNVPDREAVPVLAVTR